jgi:hypothetical protein
LQQIEEWRGVDRGIFENEIFPANQPAVLRGLVRDWPAVQAARQSPASVANYLKQCDTGDSVNAYVGRPEIKGRFFYADDFKGFNFNSQDVSISTALDTLVSLAGNPEPPAIALQAIEVPKMLPGLLEDNAMPLLDSNIVPLIWISSRSMVAAHFDVSHNIACVVGGSRKFTVFPPDQIGNLYIGPLMTTPGGPPISVVDLRNPDHEKFPRFARALESAQEAILEPGDAVYIPILWWHGVESLDALNILVNYWWNNSVSARHDPLLSLFHTMALMSGLPAVQLDAWREIFDCLAFQRDGVPGAHLPANLRDVMGNLSPADRDQVLAIVAERMQRQTV